MKSRVLFISDLHFSHKNILKYEPIREQYTAEFMVKNKIFENTEEALKWIRYSLDNETSIDELLSWHDKMLIYYWNKTVTNNDVVWVLGDVGFGGKSHISGLVSQLNGKKKLIIGNHDNLNEKYYHDMGFEFVSKYPVILKNKFLLSHAPFEREETMIDENGNETTVIIKCPDTLFNIFGHVHSKAEYQTHTKSSMCVCVERHNFKPISIKEFDESN